MLRLVSEPGPAWGQRQLCEVLGAVAAWYVCEATRVQLDLAD